MNIRKQSTQCLSIFCGKKIFRRKKMRKNDSVSSTENFGDVNDEENKKNQIIKIKTHVA